MGRDTPLDQVAPNPIQSWTLPEMWQWGVKCCLSLSRAVGSLISTFLHMNGYTVPYPTSRMYGQPLDIPPARAFTLQCCCASPGALPGATPSLSGPGTAQTVPGKLVPASLFLAFPCSPLGASVHPEPASGCCCWKCLALTLCGV